jgi:class 3 adenylate cyclase/uncharacterized protein (DUF427 family)
MDGAAYRISMETVPRRIRVVLAGVTVADSVNARVLHETRQRPTYYFPRGDVRMDLLEATAQRTHCPFKGNASYWTVHAGDRVAEHAVWSYETPLSGCTELAGLLAFDASAMDSWYADDAVLEGSQRVDLDAPNPHAMWLMHAADQSQGPERLLEAFAAHLRDEGVPLLRIGILVRTLHPQVFARGVHVWRDGVAETFEVPFEDLSRAEFRDSPYAPILSGEGGVRHGLDGGEALPFPVLDDLQGSGGTDYVAMPMRFSDGQINILTLVADAPGGFRTDQLGLVHEVLPLLAAIFEVHAQRHLSGVLLDTYLGTQTGMRVLEGRIRRGDGETIHAVIWFSDLRDSTRLTETLGRERYLALLNEYFDCMAGAVLAHGGEVLKYIGDAVMAIFPVADAAEEHPAAARAALEAARDATHRVEGLNAVRAGRGDGPIGFGIALHRGEFTYGNVGTARRLDFTVIGGAANEAARIEAETKRLGEPVVISEAVATSVAETLRPLGTHALRGVGEPMALFGL